MKHCSVCHKDVKLGAVLFSRIHGLVAAPYTQYTDLSCSGPESKGIGVREVMAKRLCCITRDRQPAQPSAKG